MHTAASTIRKFSKLGQDQNFCSLTERKNWKTGVLAELKSIEKRFGGLARLHWIVRKNSSFINLVHRRDAVAMASAADLGKLGVGNHEFEFDLFVIGGGSAGTRASRFSAGFGAKVAVCELPYSPLSTETTLGGLGGTCVLRGCVPKKILVYGSSFSPEFSDAQQFGWDIEPSEIKFNWKRLIDNKSREIARLNSAYKGLLVGAGVTVFEGFGKLVDKHTVELKHSSGEVKTYTANHILISTGSRAQVLNIPGKELGITSDEALSLDELPKKVVIVGGGYIAVEFAGIFNGLGAEVHLFYRKDLPLTGFDKEMQAVVAGNLKSRGINLHPLTNILELKKSGNGGKITAVSDKKEDFVADAVMFATGRKPNSKWLNLEAAGVKVDARSGTVKVNEYSQTNVPNIWAAGDVTNRIMLTPVVLMEGTALAKTLFGGKPTKPDFKNVPSAVFCQPTLSLVGLSEEEAIAQATGDVLVFTSSFNPMKNTISGRQEKSHMKLLVDAATDKVLGACMCGPDAPEIIQGVAIAIKCGATKAQFDSTVAIHPTAGEEFVTMRTPTRTVNRDGEVSKL